MTAGAKKSKFHICGSVFTGLEEEAWEISSFANVKSPLRDIAIVKWVSYGGSAKKLFAHSRSAAVCSLTD